MCIKHIHTLEMHVHHPHTTHFRNAYGHNPHGFASHCSQNGKYKIYMCACQTTATHIDLVFTVLTSVWCKSICSWAKLQKCVDRIHVFYIKHIHSLEIHVHHPYIKLFTHFRNAYGHNPHCTQNCKYKIYMCACQTTATVQRCTYSDYMCWNWAI
jgi:hypothetical protein